jgi:hypothetical protein
VTQFLILIPALLVIIALALAPQLREHPACQPETDDGRKDRAKHPAATDPSKSDGHRDCHLD